MVLMSQTKKGTEYSASMQGQPGPVDDATKSELDAQASIFEERYMLAKGYKADIKGIEKVEGKDAYLLNITSPAGSTSQLWYEVATGLKLQESKEQEMGPMGKVVVTSKFLEYKAFNGVMIPVKISVDAGQFKQDVDITDVKINSGLKLTDL
jgi:hypothetical protein